MPIAVYVDSSMCPCIIAPILGDGSHHYTTKGYIGELAAGETDNTTLPHGGSQGVALGIRSWAAANVWGRKE
jgi:hypothetical protein